MSRNSETVTSVGAVVVQDDRLLVARLTYSPTKGQYMPPGGGVESGELMDGTVARELREETGVEAQPLGIIGVSTIVYVGQTHTYIIWLMEPVAGEPLADGREVDDCCYLTFDEIEARDDVSNLVKVVSRRLRSGTVTRFTPVIGYAEMVPGVTELTGTLYMAESVNVDGSSLAHANRTDG